MGWGNNPPIRKAPENSKKGKTKNPPEDPPEQSTPLQQMCVTAWLRLKEPRKPEDPEGGNPPKIEIQCKGIQQSSQAQPLQQ